MHRLLLPCALALAAAAHAEPAADARQWVQASWLNVREQPARTAKVVANWVTNTPLAIDERRDGWCHARADDAATGWVACEFLAPQPATLRLPGEAPRPTDTDDAARAFWIAPSLARLGAAGAMFNSRALTAEQAAREAATKTPVRFSLPEFEAMKQRVQHALVPRLEQEIARVDIASWTTLATGRADASPGSDPTARLLRTIDPLHALSAARPSLFRQQGDALVFPDASVDAVIAMQGAPGKVGFGGKPAWIDGQYDAGVNSIWDVGDVHVRYATPAVLLQVGRQGRLGGRLVDGGTATGTDYGQSEGNCNDAAALPGNDHAPPGFAPIKDDETLIAFYVPKALAPGKVEVLSRKRRVNLPANDVAGNPFEPAQRTFLVHEIDLDRDGNADLAVIELLEEDGSVSGVHALRWQFINVAGRWWYAGLYRLDECG